MEYRCKYCNKRDQWNRQPSDDEIRLFEDLMQENNMSNVKIIEYKDSNVYL